MLHMSTAGRPHLPLPLYRALEISAVWISNPHKTNTNNNTTIAPHSLTHISRQVESSSGAGSDRTFERVYEYLPMEVPSARSIRRLAAFDGE